MDNQDKVAAIQAYLAQRATAERTLAVTAIPLTADFAGAWLHVEQGAMPWRATFNEIARAKLASLNPTDATAFWAPDRNPDGYGRSLTDDSRMKSQPSGAGACGGPPPTSPAPTRPPRHAAPGLRDAHQSPTSPPLCGTPFASRVRGLSRRLWHRSV